MCKLLFELYISTAYLLVRLNIGGNSIGKERIPGKKVSLFFMRIVGVVVLHMYCAIDAAMLILNPF